MAGTKFGGKNGAVTIGGINGDFYEQSLRIRQDVEDASSYASSEWGEKGCSGLKDGTVTASFYAKYNAASTSPGIADISDADAAFTLTLNTGCTYSGNLKISEATISQTRRSGVTRGTITGETNGTVTETWDESA